MLLILQQGLEDLPGINQMLQKNPQGHEMIAEVFPLVFVRQLNNQQHVVEDHRDTSQNQLKMDRDWTLEGNNLTQKFLKALSIFQKLRPIV